MFDAKAGDAPPLKWSRLFKELKGYWLHIAVILVLSAASVALNVAAPNLLGDATNVIFAGILGRHLPAGVSIDKIVAGMRAQGKDRLADMLAAAGVVPGQGIDFDKLAYYCALVLGFYVAAALLLYLAGRIVRRVIQETGFRIRRQCAQKIDSLTLGYLDRQERGDLLSRVTNDVDNLTQSLQQTLSQMFTAVLQLIGISAMMLWISWKLALIALVVLPIGGGLAAVVMKNAKPHFKAQWAATGKVSATVEEAFTGSQVMSLYRLEDAFNETFDEHNNQLQKSSFKANFISSLLQPMMSFIGNLSYVIVAVGGGVMVAHGSMTLGGVQAFIQYSRQLGQPLSQLSGIANLLQSASASAARIFEFLDVEETIPEDVRSADSEGSNPSAPVIDSRGVIEFKNVTFSYEPGKPVIKNLSLRVEPGHQVAIVGPTGAGKTTLVNLLLRFYEVDSGAITIDGVDIRDIPRQTLRARMGMVLQDTWLIRGSIAENIAFGTDQASEAEIEEAARAACAHRLISTLPEGYETELESEGQSLSAGEKQLLTIARAFISKPDILILDEATSSVDTRTEMLIGKAMGRLRQGRTSFVIAHRLSTIRDADLIIVMEDGDVVEQGNHTELLEKNGEYARLYQAQFDAPEETAA